MSVVEIHDVVRVVWGCCGWGPMSVVDDVAPFGGGGHVSKSERVGEGLVVPLEVRVHVVDVHSKVLLYQVGEGGGAVRCLACEVGWQVSEAEAEGIGCVVDGVGWLSGRRCQCGGSGCSGWSWCVARMRHTSGGRPEGGRLVAPGNGCSTSMHAG